MNTKKIEEIESFSAQEGTKIRQIFSPADTDNAIRYSLAHCTINPGNSSKPHTMKTSEIFYILQGSGIMHVGTEQKEITKNEAERILKSAHEHEHNQTDIKEKNTTPNKKKPKSAVKKTVKSEKVSKK